MTHDIGIYKKRNDALRHRNVDIKGPQFDVLGNIWEKIHFRINTGCISLRISCIMRKTAYGPPHKCRINQFMRIRCLMRGLCGTLCGQNDHFGGVYAAALKSFFSTFDATRASNGIFLDHHLDGWSCPPN